MIEIELNETLPHGQEFLMDMVLDVERYDEFVPFCKSCQIKEKSHKQGYEVMIAAMSVGVAFASETFVTRVVSERGEGKISVTGLDGPLKHLRNDWHFKPCDENGTASTEVAFRVAFEFKSKTLNFLAKNNAEDVCQRILQSFKDRAETLSNG